MFGGRPDTGGCLWSRFNGCGRDNLREPRSGRNVDNHQPSLWILQGRMFLRRKRRLWQLERSAQRWSLGLFHSQRGRRCNVVNDKRPSSVYDHCLFSRRFNGRCNRWDRRSSVLEHGPGIQLVSTDRGWKLYLLVWRSNVTQRIQRCSVQW